MADNVHRFKLAEVPEGLSDKSAQAYVSKGITEGRRREKHEQAKQAILIATKHQGELEGLKSAHVDELNRSGKIVSRAAHRDGLLQGTILGMLAAIGLAFSTWIILREVVITNVSTQRVPMAGDGVPELVDRAEPVPYPRNAREPGSAGDAN